MKSVYVIASLRSLMFEILTEQTLNELEALLSESHVADLTRRVDGIERALVSNSRSTSARNRPTP